MELLFFISLPPYFRIPTPFCLSHQDLKQDLLEKEVPGR